MMDSDDIAAGGCFLAGVGLFVAAVISWFTHIFWFFGVVTDEAATFGQALFFVIGLICVPIGCLHGIWLWFH